MKSCHRILSYTTNGFNRTLKWLLTFTISTSLLSMSNSNVDQINVLPYHEPDRITVLTQASFFLLLNFANWPQIKYFIGLVAQILLGVVFGSSRRGLARGACRTNHGAGRLPGIDTDGQRGLLENATLSVLVALTGIIVPIGFSFLLGPLAGATPLQCFAAVAALSATSLGTTFAVLATAGLTDTRLGTVLASAAMMDDVVGLVLISIVTNLGKDIGAGTIIGRPIGALIGLLVVTALAFMFEVWPLWRLLPQGREKQAPSRKPWWSGHRAAFTVQTLLLIAFITVAAWAGTSVLFALISDAIVSWWDSEIVNKVDIVQQSSDMVASTDILVKEELTLIESCLLQSSDRSACVRTLHLALVLLQETRGEIGVLIAALANNNGVFSNDSIPTSASSDLYNIVTWAILICTVLGPIGVGGMIRKVQASGMKAILGYGEVTLEKACNGNAQ
ncbi:hypothetical protein BDZ91DRAFT_785299 [Kalaharituber pfeilii]|nr:hypothetical protein BDZ91DRAFT_785299 [Kalaharituber pfeilii]